MTAIERLRESARETTDLAEAVMRNPAATEREFAEAFRARDIARVEAQGYDEEQLAELRYEAMAGCYGDDSEYHSYFGL